MHFAQLFEFLKTELPFEIGVASQDTRACAWNIKQDPITLLLQLLPQLELVVGELRVLDASTSQALLSLDLDTFADVVQEDLP